MAALQWNVLQRHLPSAKRWIITNALGGAPAGLVVVAAVFMSSGKPELEARLRAVAAVVLFIDLLIIGAVQWWGVRRHLTGSGWWVVAGGASGLAGGVLFIFTPQPSIYPLLSTSLLYPALTGLVLVRLSRPTAASSSHA